jgi:hypothetical protein
MKRFKTKKGLALLLVLVVAAITAVGAVAWFSSTGTGVGSADVGTSSTIQLSSPNVGNLFPGGVDVPVTVTMHNPGQGDEYVGTVSGVVNTDDNGTPANPADDCLGSWFTVDSVNYNDYLTRNTTVGDTDTVNTNVRMNESGGPQDACQGKTLSITWSSS